MPEIKSNFKSGEQEKCIVCGEECPLGAFRCVRDPMDPDSDVIILEKEKAAETDPEKG